MEELKPQDNRFPESVKEQYSRIEQVYKAAPVGLCFLNTDLRFLHINEYLAAIHHRSVEEHQGQTVRDMVPALADIIEPLVRKVIDSGENLFDIEFEEARPTALSTTGDWRASFLPMVSDENRVLGVTIVVQDVTDLQRNKRLLEDRIRFERIISELSALLIGLAPEQIDSKINEGLAVIGRFIDVDRCFVCQFSSDKREFRMTHMWTNEHVQHDPIAGSVVMSDYAPWFTRETLSGRSFIFTDPEEIPDEAAAEKEYAKKTGIRSSAIVPLIVGGDVIGNFGFDMVGRQRNWSEDDLQRLRLASQMFVSALKRQRDEAEIGALHRFEQLIADISSRFVNIAPEQVDPSIETALGDVSNCLETHLGTLLLLEPGSQNYRVTHEWQGPIVPEGAGFKGINVGEIFPWLAKALNRRLPLSIDSLEQWPAEAADERSACEALGIKSVLWVPFEVGGQLSGYIVQNTLQRQTVWSDDYIQRLRLVGEVFGHALLRKQSEQQLRTAHSEIAKLNERLESENLYLRDAIESLDGHDQIIGRSKGHEQMLLQAKQVAKTDSTVLLCGETGTGKELLAHEIHRMSSRSKHTMVIVNCGALPAALIEAELFGREKGAYTGALSRQAGRFELADGSTLFLDEVGELPAELQTRLLRFLQDGSFQRLGGTRTINVDVRVIAATHRDLAAEVRKGSFREDLFYRLNVFPITIPALRDRRQDIPLLVWAFVKEFSERMGKVVERIPSKTMEKLQRYRWPGNVRELRNVVERAMIIANSKTLRIELSTTGAVQPAGDETLASVERAHIEHILLQTNWRIAGKSGAAEILGLKPTTLRSRMERLGLPTRPPQALNSD